MKNFFTLRNMALVILFVIGIIGVKAWTSVPSQNQNRVRIENRTPALAVQSLRELRTVQNNTMFEIALRNVSPKPISELTLKIEDEHTNKKDLNLVTMGALFSDWNIQPGETKSMWFKAASTGNVTLTIAAVLFMDGESSGDAFFTGDLLNRRNGVRQAYQRILPILRKYVNPQSPDIPDEAVQAMLNEIKAVDERSVPKNFLGGFLDGKREITSDIEYSLKEKERKRNDPQFKLKDKLQNKTEKVQRVLSKF